MPYNWFLSKASFSLVEIGLLSFRFKTFFRPSRLLFAFSTFLTFSKFSMSNSVATIAFCAFLTPITGYLLVEVFLGFPWVWQVEWWLIVGVVLDWWFNHDAGSFAKWVSIRSMLLGALFNVGLQLSVKSESNSAGFPFGLILLVLTFFHWSEFWITAYRNPLNVKLSDFVFVYDFEKDRPEGFLSDVLNWISNQTYKGFEHHIAMLGPAVEFVFESWWFYEWKFAFPWCSYLGFAVCACAEAIRKTAMLNAGKNFNHVVQEQRHKEHQLVTGGIYSWWRHPSYVGQFWWILGTQIILVNPIGFLVFPILVWRFTKRRIVREEEKLVEFFGADYVEYRRRVPSGIPFIN